MKRNVMLTVFALLSVMMQAQIARWVIKPNMDNIDLDPANKMFVCHRADSNFVWTVDGKRIVNTTATIAPISDRTVLLINEEDGGLYGFTNAEGNFKNMVSTGDRCRYLINKKFPYFSHGLLLVKDTDDNLYYYVNSKGQILGDGYVAAYPFLNRCASVVAYVDDVKRKDVYTKLINTRFDEILMTKNSKMLKSGAFDFISSVSKEKIAVCIDGKIVYSYDSNTDDCVRFSIDDSSVKSSFVQLLDKTIVKHDTDDGGFYIDTDKGKMQFNVNGQFVGADWMTAKETDKDGVKEYSKRIETYEENGLFGLKWNYNDEHYKVLPCQFEEVKSLYDNVAVVKLNGKYGVVRVENLKSMNVEVNEGKPVIFEHGKTESNLIISFPFLIDKSELDDVACVGSDSCLTDMSSMTEKYVNTGSKFEFSCVLSAPENLKEQSEVVEYPLVVKYQGLTSIPASARIRASYNNSYELKVLKTGLIKDTVYVEVEAVTCFDSLDVHEVSLSLQSDSVMSYRVGRISNKKFGVKIYDMNAGQTPLTFITRETGCPKVPFRYVLAYVRPAGKNKGSVRLEPEKTENE